MLILISPAKTLDYDTPATTKKATQPTMLAAAQVLIDELRALAPQDISKLMHINGKLGSIKYDRYKHWKQAFPRNSAEKAVQACKGDV